MYVDIRQYLSKSFKIDQFIKSKVKHQTKNKTTNKVSQGFASLRDLEFLNLCIVYSRNSKIVG